jgi:phosphate uptake regulator
MSTAKKYFQKQLSIPEFKQSYMEEKVKLDIEYQLEELKKDIQCSKPSEEIIKRIDRLEKYVLSV